MKRDFKKSSAAKSSAVGAMLLAAALSACAPAVVGPTSLPIMVRGQAYDVAVKVPLAELNTQTSDTVYVTFPECGAAVLSAFVRQRGPDEGARACRAAASETGLNVLKVIGVGVGVGLIAFLTLIWAIVTGLGTG